MHYTFWQYLFVLHNVLDIVDKLKLKVYLKYTPYER